MPVMIGFVVSFLALRSRSLLIGLERLFLALYFLLIRLWRLYSRFRLPILNAV